MIMRNERSPVSEHTVQTPSDSAPGCSVQRLACLSGVYISWRGERASTFSQ